MPRQLRLEYPGAIYHLMNRGDCGEPIFKDDRDPVRFLETLGQTFAKTQRNKWDDVKIVPIHSGRLLPCP